MKYIFYFILFLLAGGSWYIYNSKEFERNKPSIEFKSNSYWNLKSPLFIDIIDESDIKSIRVEFIQGKNLQEANFKELNIVGGKRIVIEKVKFNMFFKKDKPIKLKVMAIDNSKWNFFNGNKNSKEFNIILDTKKPEVDVVSNTYAIRRGGSAIAIVKVNDKYLKEKYILFNDIKYPLIPFYKENYYICLIAWPVFIKFKEFKKVTLVAEDLAGNISKIKVPFYIRRMKVKKDKIRITDRFIDNIALSVLEKEEVEIPKNPKDIFLKVNRYLREQNIKEIYNVVRDNTNTKNLQEEFLIYRFKRLTNSKRVARYGEKRSYYYKGKKIDTAWHLGIDFASVKKASIRLSNSGKVIFKDYLGIYGNTIMIEHFPGFVSLYAHTSSQFVEKGDFVKKGSIIAKTGSTGAVFGDHLHFGIVINGYEVDPIEWMDRNWIKTRIFNVIKEAKQRMDKGH